MKKYSSNRAQKGKTAYRTPDRFIYKMALRAMKFSPSGLRRTRLIKQKVVALISWAYCSAKPSNAQEKLPERRFFVYTELIEVVE